MAEWTKGAFTVSTDPARVNLEALNDALDSSVMWWARRLSPEDLRTMVFSSLCFSLHGPVSVLDKPAAASELAPEGQQQQRMIGLARLITDHVTFAYLTDVYVLPSHQGIGLGRWLLSCVSAHVDANFPELRGLLLLTHGEKAVAFYRQVVGVAPQTETSLKDLVVMHREGPGAPRAPGSPTDGTGGGKRGGS